MAMAKEIGKIALIVVGVLFVANRVPAVRKIIAGA